MLWHLGVSETEEVHIECGEIQNSGRSFLWILVLFGKGRG